MHEFARRFAHQRSALFGLALGLVIVLASAAGPLLYHASPTAIDHRILGAPQPPSLVHPLGTDLLGRDQLARLLYGGRISLTVGFVSMIVAVVAGTLYGAIAGAAGSRVGALMMRLVDALMSFPTFFLIITVEVLTNRFSVAVIILVIGLLSWMGVARLVRAEVLSLRERDFVQAEVALGASPARIVLRHLIPNAITPVIVAATLAIGDNILAEAGLSFLGLGVQIPTPSWGNMLQETLNPAIRSAPWLVVTPGLMIVLTLVSFSLISEGLQFALDRSLQGSPASRPIASAPTGSPGTLDSAAPA
jgi:peptide/nickel transport system permease protein